MVTTVGQMLINEVLPPDMQDPERKYDAEGIKKLFKDIAEKYPDKYADINRRLNAVASESISTYGGPASVSLNDLRPSDSVRRIRQEVKDQIEKIHESNLSEKEKDDKIIQLLSDHLDLIAKTNYEEGLASNNGFARQVASGARGNKIQFMSLRAGDVMVADQNSQPIPIPMLSSYAEGLDPVQYWAGGYGARQGTISAKFCLAEGTKVVLSDFSLKAIEQIKPGDMVLGFDLKSSLPVKVLDVYNNGKRTCHKYKLIAASKENLEVVCTEDHKVLCNSGEIRNIGDLPDNELRLVNNKAARIYSVDAMGQLDTYDLHVDNPNHLFVIEGGLIVGNSTPKSGFLGKQLFQAAHRLVVTEKDCGTTTGIPVHGDDSDNEGAVLIGEVDGLASGTVLTPKNMSKLGGKRILVRSPMTCQAENGVCQICAGHREKGGFPPIGDNIGASAAAAVTEPLSQMQLSAKHGGGVATKSVKAKGGLDFVTKMVQVPENFPEMVPVASTDGSIDKVEPAPQGGSFIYIGKERHWLPQGTELAHKIGDRVEAGDALGKGMANPADVVKYKGIGEGRRYFMEQFRHTLVENKVPIHRRNVELLARGLINHVRINDLDGPGNTIPDDVVEYDGITRNYQPRFGSKKVAPKDGIGLYLEKPALHYSIGTRITPTVVSRLSEHGVNEIEAHRDHPSFEPEMVRAMENLTHADDWMTRLGGFYLQRSLLQSARRGSDSNVHGTSYIPSLAEGVEFGKSPTGKGY